MNLEVELKYAVGSRTDLESRLLDMGADFNEPTIQVDTYFSHPVRDFATTDEAVRVRHEADGCWITYKGPKLDATTKTRQEIDVPLSDEGQHTPAVEMLKALGFQPVAIVKKVRRQGLLEQAGQQVTVALDTIEGLGEFIEFEIIATKSESDAARDVLQGLAQLLGLSQTERRSYLELLLAQAHTKSQ